MKRYGVCATVGRTYRQLVVFCGLFLACMGTATSQDATPAYRVGDRLEVDWKGTWYKAEIIETKEGSYKIRYDGYSSTWDEWVQPARMRRVAASAPEKDTAVHDQDTAVHDQDTAVQDTAAEGATSTDASSDRASGPLKIDVVVELRPSTGNWDEGILAAGKIIEILPAEPKYRIRRFTKEFGYFRDLYYSSKDIRRAQYAVYDDYDPRLLIGSWGCSWRAGLTALPHRTA